MCHSQICSGATDRSAMRRNVEPASANGIDWHAHYVYAHEPKFREFGGEENKDVKKCQRRDATCALPCPWVEMTCTCTNSTRTYEVNVLIFQRWLPRLLQPLPLPPPPSPRAAREYRPRLWPEATASTTTRILCRSSSPPSRRLAHRRLPVLRRLLPSYRTLTSSFPI